MNDLSTAIFFLIFGGLFLLYLAFGEKLLSYLTGVPENEEWAEPESEIQKVREASNRFNRSKLL